MAPLSGPPASAKTKARQRMLATRTAIFAPSLHAASDRVGMGVRAAIDAGWLKPDPSPIMTDALGLIHHETLWLALHLDTDTEVAFARRLRRRCRQLASDIRTLRVCAATLERLVGPDLESSLARVSKSEACFKHGGRMLADLDRAHMHVAGCAAEAQLELLMLESATIRADRRGGRRASRWRGAVLDWLLRILHDWTRPKLAELIIASNRHFKHPPCPAFVADTDVGALAERITKLIERWHKLQRATG